MPMGDLVKFNPLLASAGTAERGPVAPVGSFFLTLSRCCFRWPGQAHCYPKKGLEGGDIGAL